MNQRTWLTALLAAGCLAVVFRSEAQLATQISPLTTIQLWQRLEFQITNVPAATNPFDPDKITVDATFTLPSGKTITVPAFWYQAYQRSKPGTVEQLAAVGAPGWRLRYTPTESGTLALSLIIRTNGQLAGAPVSTNFTVPAAPLPARYGYVSVATNKMYFQTGDGQAMPLRGENVAFGTPQGTYAYDMYLPAMAAAGENFARVIMTPMGFGIEVTPTSLTQYSSGPAWQLDYILQLAEQNGIYVQLCLDYHGMYVTQPDPTFGGNNYWPQNPYNTANGGPCSVANGFFTNSVAKVAYQKRLRYLIARYGYSQYLVGWELQNEIDNDYSIVNSTDVTAWHGTMGGWLRTNDVYHHLITTSLAFATSHLQMWALPQIDYVSEHSYGRASPATSLAADIQFFLTYPSINKPVMIGEFGTSFLGWNRSADPYLRGFRQGLWGGALGGSVGTSMSWWWQNIHGDNVYPVYVALGKILNRTGWGKGGWTKVTLQPSTAGIGLKGANESLIYLVAPGLAYPSGATTNPPPTQHAQTITLKNWAAGNFIAEWYDPATATAKGQTQSTTTNGDLMLPIPDYTEDLAALVYPPPRLTTTGFSPTNGLQLRLDSETGGQYTIQGTTNFSNWSSLLSVTNTTARLFLNVPSAVSNPWSVFRAKHN